MTVSTLCLSKLLDMSQHRSSLIRRMSNLQIVKISPGPEKPYDPFGDGLDIRRKDYYVLKDHYPSQWLEEARTNTTMAAGGFDIKEYYPRTLFEAFAGLGCFIDEEVAKRDAGSERFGVKKAIAT